MKKTLLINLTRFGDLIQTQPAIDGLAAAGHEVGLVCLTPFAGAAHLLAHVAHVFPLPGETLLAGLDRDWRAALADLLAWRAEVLAAFRPDEVITFTATRGARLLGRLFLPDGARPGGFGLDEEGFGVDANRWAAFLFASTQARRCSPYNLADLFREVACVSQWPPHNALREPDAATTARAASLLAGRTPKALSGHLPVAFQPGASHPQRQWPVAHFARLGDALFQEHRLLPVLVGSAADAPLAEEYARLATGPFVSLIGATTLPELAAILRRCRLLVTNDTGTMHLAAALGVPIAAIFLATAQPWDTGPYQAGCLCLEPDLACHPCDFNTPCPHLREQNELASNACRFAIAPDTVRAHIAAWLATGAWQAPTAPAGARAWVTFFDGAAPYFQDLRALGGHEESERVAWIRCQRRFLAPFLNDDAAALASLPPVPAGTRVLVGATAQAAGTLLHLLLEQGSALQKAPVPLLKKRFLTTLDKLDHLWSKNPAFTAIGQIWMREVQAAGDELADVLAIARRYRQLMDYLAGPERSSGGPDTPSGEPDSQVAPTRPQKGDAA